MNRNSKSNILDILDIKFVGEKTRVNRLIGHFTDVVQKLEESDWGGSLTSAGKFSEVVARLIYKFADETLPTNERSFNADRCFKNIIKLKLVEKGHDYDGVYRHIPQAGILIYGIGSSRGGRHDSDKFDPNETDALMVFNLCSWIFVELIYFCSLANLPDVEVSKIIEQLVKREYPIIENIDGDIYVSKNKHKSANQCALLILNAKYPERMSIEELKKAVVRNGYKPVNLRIDRLSDYIHSDENNSILLRDVGRKKAKELLID